MDEFESYSISISGPICSGKSTLMENLQKDFQSKGYAYSKINDYSGILIKETFCKIVCVMMVKENLKGMNSFLEKFYEEQKKCINNEGNDHAAAIQIFCASHFLNIYETIERVSKSLRLDYPRKKKTFVVLTERSIHETKKVFGEMKENTLQGVDKSTFDYIYSLINQFPVYRKNIFFYLRTTNDHILCERSAKRDKMGISTEYMKSHMDKYEEKMRQTEILESQALHCIESTNKQPGEILKEFLKVFWKTLKNK